MSCVVKRPEFGHALTSLKRFVFCWVFFILYFELEHMKNNRETKESKESVYNADIERILTTDYNFDLTIEEIQKLENSAGTITVERLVATIRRCLKVYLISF